VRLFSSIPSYLKPLFKILQCRPNKLALYVEALSHKSGKNADTNYERLEFLGDAILSSIFADYIYHHFPKEIENKIVTGSVVGSG
jgi:ribonuclease-3